MKTVAINDLAARLIADLRRDYPTGTLVERASAQPLRERFATFGAEASTSHVRLEEAMSAAIAALQDLFDRTGGQGGDPATALESPNAMVLSESESRARFGTLDSLGRVLTLVTSSCGRSPCELIGAGP